MLPGIRIREVNRAAVYLNLNRRSDDSFDDRAGGMRVHDEHRRTGGPRIECCDVAPGRAERVRWA